jgi:cytidylate kinase
MKFNVVGTSGSGKTTLARRIAGKLDIPYVELDALFWRPDWQETPDEAFFARLEAALADKESWVLDGNYNRTQALKWRHVDMIVCSRAVSSRDTSGDASLEADRTLAWHRQSRVVSTKLFQPRLCRPLDIANLCEEPPPV